MGRGVSHRAHGWRWGSELHRAKGSGSSPFVGAADSSDDPEPVPSFLTGARISPVDFRSPVNFGSPVNFRSPVNLRASFPAGGARAEEAEDASRPQPAAVGVWGLVSGIWCLVFSVYG